jgi:hypothetical protein
MKVDKQSSAEHPRRRHRPYAWLLGSLFILILAVVVFSPRRRVAPQELIGVWTTSDPNYRDRFLAIYSGSVSFGTGEGTVTTGFIQNIEEVSGEGEVVYSLTYVSDDGQQKLSLSLERATGFLRLQNQPKIVWKKSASV